MSETLPLPKTSKKRKQLIDHALRLFGQHGIHAVGINEILATSGVAKKTLYNHFVSKEALIQACVLERDSRFMTWFEQACDKADSTASLIECVFDALDNWVNDRVDILGHFNGCFFVNTAAEYSKQECVIYQHCIQHKNNIKALFQLRLTPYISDEIQRNNLVELLLLLKEGVINCAHVMNDKQSAVKAKTLALAYV